MAEVSIAFRANHFGALHHHAVILARCHRVIGGQMPCGGHPVLGSCGGPTFARATAYDGAAAGVIEGNVVAATYTVDASAPDLTPLSFSYTHNWTIDGSTQACDTPDRFRVSSSFLSDGGLAWLPGFFLLAAGLTAAGAEIVDLTYRREFVEDPACLRTVATLIGSRLDCFLSQFIFKNPGAWGQPWHQDSYYFPFEPARPVTAIWLAITAMMTPANASRRNCSHTQA